MKLFFSESGRENGGIPVVLLHGFCESHQVWRRFEKELGAHFHVLCPDLPGFGNSSLIAGDINLSIIADKVYDWLKELGIDQCILIGHSLGGYVSLAFLEKYGDMVEGVGMFHSTAYADSEEKKRVRDNVIAFVEKNGVEKYITSFVPPLFYHKKREALQKEINELISVGCATPKESIIAYTRAMQQRQDRLQVLQHFKKPVLYIIGEEDNSITLEDSKKQLMSLSNYELHILKGTGHMGMFEKPEESLEAVKNFINFIIDKKRSS